MNKKVNLFIVGAAKSGTTSLYSMLDRHSEIFMCPIKEPHHFSKDIEFKLFREEYKKSNCINTVSYLKNGSIEKKHMAFISKKDLYSKIFKDSRNEKYIGEASPSYLYSKVAADNIYNYNNYSKIIIILRDPIDRIISHYKMDISSGRQVEKNILKGVLNDYKSKKKGWGSSNLYIELSKYKDQVSRYLNLFKNEDLLVLDFNDLKYNINSIVIKVSKFLEISEIKEFEVTKSNKTRMPKNKFIKQALKYWQEAKPFKIPSFVKNIAYKTQFKDPPVYIEKNFYREMNNLLEEDIVFYNSLFDKNPISTYS